jgi:hypothetical protein
MQNDISIILNSMKSILRSFHIENRKIKRENRKTKRTRKEIELKERTRNRWDIRPKICWTCREKFESGGLLHRHIRDNQTHGEWPFGCPYG